MKLLLIRLLLWPHGLVFIGVFCSLSLAFLNWPVQGATSSSGGDEFPGQTQGGGTHWTQVPNKVI